MIINHEQKHRQLDKFLALAGPWAERNPNPSDGALYKDTDRDGMEFRWKASVANPLTGTNGAWLSTGNPSSWQMAFPQIGITATTINAHQCDFTEETSAIYLVKVVVAAAVGTTFNVTDTWSFQLKYQNDVATLNNIGPATSIFQVTRVAGRRYQTPLYVNTIYPPATTKLFLLDWNKAASAGALTSLTPTLYYRLVG